MDALTEDELNIILHGLFDLSDNPHILLLLIKIDDELMRRFILNREKYNESIH